MNTSDEINLHQLLQIFTKRWKYLLVLALVFTLVALSKHKYFPNYPGSGKLIIKDVRNSQLQSIIGQVAGVSSEILNADLKGNDLVVHAETLLDVHEFYMAVANRLYEIKRDVKNPSVIHFFKSISRSENDPEFMHEVAIKLERLLSFNSSRGDVLIVESKSGNKDLSVMLVNETLREAQMRLTEGELADLNRAENYFREEIEGVRARLDFIENSTVRKMQKNQIFSVDMEKGENVKYISDLKKNINDAEIAISNNLEKIALLNQKIKETPAINTALSKFNESSQVKALEDQNSDLRLELKTNHFYLKNFEIQKNGLVPFQYEIEKMNANHEFEYKLYASLNDGLSRIGLQKTYAKNKVEILELERGSKVHSSPSLGILVLIALTLSQVIGVFSIYLYELFKPIPKMLPY